MSLMKRNGLFFEIEVKLIWGIWGVLALAGR